MHYGLVFLRRAPGQSWDEALARRTEAAGDDDGQRPSGSRVIESWDRLVARAEAVLGPVEVTNGPAARELMHAETGIELTMSADEVGISVAYDRGGGSALEVMERVYALARIVEEETGLEGYDLQLEEPFTDAARGIADEARSVAAEISDDDGRGGAGPSGTADRLQHIADAPDTTDARGPSAGLSTSRRWWEFWRR